MTMALQRPMLPLPTAEALSIPGETGERETVVIRWVDSPFWKTGPKSDKCSESQIQQWKLPPGALVYYSGLILPAGIYGFILSHKYQGSLLIKQYSMVYVESCSCSVHFKLAKSTFYSETVVKLQTFFWIIIPKPWGFSPSNLTCAYFFIKWVGAYNHQPDGVCNSETSSENPFHTLPGHGGSATLAPSITSGVPELTWRWYSGYLILGFARCFFSTWACKQIWWVAKLNLPWIYIYIYIIIYYIMLYGLFHFLFCPV